MKIIAFLHQPVKRSYAILRSTLGEPWIRAIQWHERCDPACVLTVLQRESPSVVLALGPTARRAVGMALHAYTEKVRVITGEHPSTAAHHVLESLKRTRVELDVLMGGTWK